MVNRSDQFNNIFNMKSTNIPATVSKAQSLKIVFLFGYQCHLMRFNFPSFLREDLMPIGFDACLMSSVNSFMSGVV